MDSGSSWWAAWTNSMVPVFSTVGLLGATGRAYGRDGTRLRDRLPGGAAPGKPVSRRVPDGSPGPLPELLAAFPVQGTGGTHRTGHPLSRTGHPLSRVYTCTVMSLGSPCQRQVTGRKVSIRSFRQCPQWDTCRALAKQAIKPRAHLSKHTRLLHRWVHSRQWRRFRW